MADDDYVEVEAVVRMRKDVPLAESRKTAGYYRGFTANSSDRGPEHVEIRFTGPSRERDSDAAYEPDVVDTEEQTAPPYERTREDKEAEQLAAAFVLIALIKAAQWAHPHVRHLLTERLFPFFVARREQWQERKLQRATARHSTGGPAGQEETAESQRVTGDALRAYEADMTSAEAREHLAELLIAQHFVREKSRLLANAGTREGAVPREVSRTVRALTPEQVAGALASVLATRPTVLRDLRALLAARSDEQPLQLRSATLSEALRLTDD